MKLSIVIVSYNTKDILRQCLESISLVVLKHVKYEVIVVDNSSTDGSCDMVEKEFNKIKLITNTKNLGFSKANNIGIHHATGSYILFLNSDTLVSDDAFTPLLEFMEKNVTVGAVTCKVVLPDGTLDDASHRGFPTPWNAFSYFSGLANFFPTSQLFAGYTLGWKDIKVAHEIDACAGAFMLVRKEAGEQVGWWDEDFFFYGEDLDFCYRLKKSGWKIFFVPTVSVLHYKGVSAGIKKVSKHLTTATEETRKTSQKARFEAMRLFYDKHYKNTYPGIVTSVIKGGIRLKELLSS